MKLFRRKEERSAVSLDEWASWFSYLGHQYPFGFAQTLQGDRIDPPGDFRGYASQLYKQNGVVFACMAARLLLFSEARFAFRELIDGRPGNIVGDRGQLALLHRPWVGGTTGDLLAKIITDADLQGDSFTLRRPRKLVRLRPDWVSVLYGTQTDDMWSPDAELLGYLYHPGGVNSGSEPEVFGPEQIAHFMPYPDPLTPGRGMSWITPVLREIMGDSAASQHKLKFFENGSTPNMAVTFPETVSPEKFREWIELFEGQHKGVSNAYKTLYLGGAAQPKTIGLDFEQMDFKVVQGAGETRIAAAAGIPPVIVGLSEGLAASTYSNYAQARRRFADGTMRPLWRNLAGSLARIFNVSPNHELWYDDRDIAFLREDEKDVAVIAQTRASTIKTLVDAGFDQSSVVDAVEADDFKRLRHTGLFSVQLQPPGTTLKVPQNGSQPQEVPI